MFEKTRHHCLWSASGGRGEVACGENMQLNGAEQWGAQQKKKSKCERHSLACKGRGGSWCGIEWHEDGALEIEMKTCMYVCKTMGKCVAK